MSGVSIKTRSKVAKRAAFRCEYCRLHEEDGFLAFEIDHIISKKHGGGNEIGNLAFACPQCNAHKGSDIATTGDSYLEIITLFHPRLQNWDEHFSIVDGRIEPKTKTGKATIKILHFNSPDRVYQRTLLFDAKRWP